MNPFTEMIGVRCVASQEYFQKLWQGGPNGNKRNITEIMKDGQWKGRRCYIVGGGPSLRMFEYQKFNEFLGGELSIGVNRAFQNYPNLTMNVASDYTFYKEVTRQVGDCSYNRYQRYKGIKLWVDHENRNMNDCYYIRSVGRNGVSWTLNGIYFHSNTGYSAIQIALALGASPIYLLGYDLCEDAEGHTHWHNYATTTFHEKSWKVFQEGLDDLVLRLKDSGKYYRIINLSPISKVAAFPKGDFFQEIDITRDNHFRHRAIVRELFAKQFEHIPMHCYVSSDDLRSVGCRSVYELENLFRKDDPQFMKGKVFFRRAA